MREAISSTDRPLAATAATAAVLGGLAWIALGADSILRPDPRDYRDALFLVPWVLYAVTLAFIHRLQRHRSGRLEGWGYLAVIITAALVAVASIDLVIGTEAVQVLGFPLGALAWTLAMVAFGAGTVRAGVFPRLVGWGIALSQPLTIALSIPLDMLGIEVQDRGSYTGVLAHGAVMLMLAATLRDVSEPAGASDGRGESLALGGGH